MTTLILPNTTTSIQNPEARFFISKQFARLAAGQLVMPSNNQKISVYLQKVQKVAGSHQQHFYAGMSQLVKDLSFPVFTKEEDLLALLTIQNLFLPTHDGLSMLLRLTEKVVNGKESNICEVLIETLGIFRPKTESLWTVFLGLMAYEPNCKMAIENWLFFYERYEEEFLFSNYFNITPSQYKVFRQLLNKKEKYSRTEIRVLGYIVQACLPIRGKEQQLVAFVKHFLEEVLPEIEKIVGKSFFQCHYSYPRELFIFYASFYQQKLTSTVTTLFRFKNLQLREVGYRRPFYYMEDIDIDIERPKPPAILWNELEESYDMNFILHQDSESEDWKKGTFINYNSPDILLSENLIKHPNLKFTFNSKSIAEKFKESSIWAIEDFCISTNSFLKMIEYLPKFILIYLHEIPLKLIIHLANGQNIRKLPAFRFMTKKMAHIFSQMNPPYCASDDILLYCLVLSLGGTTEDFIYYQSHLIISGRFSSYYMDIAHIITNVYADFSDEHLKNFADKMPQYLKMIPKLISWREEILQLNEVTQQIILSFLSHVLTDLPDYNFAGRTLASFIRAAQDYEQNNSNFTLIKNKEWKGAAYQPFKIKNYTIIQLTNSTALAQESRVMHHCVQTYEPKCIREESSIWSLKKSIDDEVVRSLVTIEISDKGTIVQAKAKYNAKPNKIHKTIIQKWATQEGLKLKP